MDSRASRSGRKRNGPSSAEVRGRFLELMQSGMPQREALERIERTRSWLAKNRRDHPDFAAAIDNSIKVFSDAKEQGRPEIGDFATFRREYLLRETYPHQQGWIDLLEGREPEVWHPSIEYHKGQSNRILTVSYTHLTLPTKA